MPRMTVEFSKEANQILEELAEKEHINKREVIRRALALYEYLNKQGVHPGGDMKVQIADKDNKPIKEIVF